jgi:hypothetical protein
MVSGGLNYAAACRPLIADRYLLTAMGPFGLAKVA